MKRIALICNMNNNLNSLGKYLRDEGFDTMLYVLPFEHEHFSPRADSAGSDSTTGVKYLSWGNPYELDQVSDSEILSEFGGYDFIIGCGTAPAYLSKVGLKLDLFTPFGSDLIDFPFLYHLRPAKFLAYLTSRVAQLLSKSKGGGGIQGVAKKSNFRGYVPFILHQRKGIRESSACFFPTSGKDIYAKSLKRLRFANNHFEFGVPMVYVPEYNSTAIKNLYSSSKWFDRFKDIRLKNDFVIFHNCRHSWKNRDTVMHKGNDRLFKGFADFLGTYKGKAAIVTFEYGTDFMESKKLCKELGIENNVHWVPLAERKELMIGMSLCDLVVGNLSDASWPLYGVVYESMAMAKPIMHHRNDQYSKELLYPMINAFTREMVTSALKYYSIHMSELEEMGANSSVWFRRNFIDASLEKILQLIREKNQQSD